ncbi:hypothetical protein QQS21_002151 [Conoideocrella luteorostrata]|uniref:Laccase n=1 Tax=Conoideocrella luteorostrata TaxID=1105319 RepID=A0AAJ0CYN9_9HYPO|nr:hypothetical protein QQS21_002151 [Conoideocrella luteorostrata]
MYFHTNFACALFAVAFHVIGSNAALRQFNFTVHGDSRSPDGFKREVYLINGLQPGPLIDVEEGDDVEVHVQNDLKVETAIHWHGLMQRGTPDMDGVPGVTQSPIPPGGNFTYKFSTKDEYGFFWYHSHFKSYYSDAIRGPLLIRPSASRKRPFESLAGNSNERAALLDAERNATNILLNDWTHELSDTISARYKKTGAFPSCADSILANGLGRVQCLPKSILNTEMELARKREGARSSMLASPTNAVKRHGMKMEGMNAIGPRGCMSPMMFKPGFDQSSLPPETCTNTTSPLLVIPAVESNGWLALNLVNSGAISALSISLDGHSMFVYAADGLYVKMQEVKVLHVELGQRYSVMIRLDQKPGNYYLRYATHHGGDMQQVLEGKATITYPTTGNAPERVTEDEATRWMYVNGSAKAGVKKFKNQDLATFDPSNFPPAGPADTTMSFVVNQTDITTWVFDREPFHEPDVPIIYGNASSGWKASTTVHLPLNSTIDVIMTVSNQSMDTMGHPLHLHGHKFWVLGSGTGVFPYGSVKDAPDGMLNLHDPPFRDTTGLPEQGWTVLR